MLVQVTEQNKEIPRYNDVRFPVFTQEIDMCRAENRLCNIHWHEELEFCVAKSGATDWIVEGQPVHLEAGEAMFINFDQAHFFSADRQNPGVLCDLKISPSLLKANQYVEQYLLNPVLFDFSFKQAKFSPEREDERQIISQIETLYDLASANKNHADKADAKPTDGWELEFLSGAFRLLRLLREFLWKEKPGLEESAEKVLWAKLEELSAPIVFIQQNYARRLSLQEIAASGNMSMSKCCHLFKQVLGLPPAEYANYYRVLVATELLRSENRTITEVALECGFSGSSYFAETFRRFTGVSPREFRGTGIKNQ